MPSFTPSNAARTSLAGDYLISPRTIVTERFTLVSHEELNYKFTVEDPTWYVRPWTGETHFTLSNESLMELACHEGNYSLRFIRSGADAGGGPITVRQRD